MRYVIVFAAILFLAACKNENTAKSSSPSETKKTQTITIPTVTDAIMGDLLNNCDQIDFIFHTLPISMNISERSTIISHLKGISPNAVEQIPVNCKPQGRIAYYSKGEMLAEADIYFDDNCKFFTFMENEKAVYGNYLNKDGINFINTIFAQIPKK